MGNLVRNNNILAIKQTSYNHAAALRTHSNLSIMGLPVYSKTFIIIHKDIVCMYSTEQDNFRFFSSFSFVSFDSHVPCGCALWNEKLPHEYKCFVLCFAPLGACLSAFCLFLYPIPTITIARCDHNGLPFQPKRSNLFDLLILRNWIRNILNNFVMPLLIRNLLPYFDFILFFVIIIIIYVLTDCERLPSTKKKFVVHSSQRCSILWIIIHICMWLFVHHIPHKQTHKHKRTPASTHTHTRTHDTLLDYL